jgi:hypothetical protein
VSVGVSGAAVGRKGVNLLLPYRAGFGGDALVNLLERRDLTGTLGDSDD